MNWSLSKILLYVLCNWKYCWRSTSNRCNRFNTGRKVKSNRSLLVAWKKMNTLTNRNAIRGKQSWPSMNRLGNSFVFQLFRFPTLLSRNNLIFKARKRKRTTSLLYWQFLFAAVSHQLVYVKISYKIEKCCTTYITCIIKMTWFISHNWRETFWAYSVSGRHTTEEDLPAKEFGSISWSQCLTFFFTVSWFPVDFSGY